MTKAKTTDKIISKEIKKPSWLKQTPKDIEEIIVKLAKQGLTSEKIGLLLRDTYGVPKAKLLGKKIGRILKENELYKDSDLENLNKKHEKVVKHIKTNKQDKRAIRTSTLLSFKLRRLKKYRKKREKI